MEPHAVLVGVTGGPRRKAQNSLSRKPRMLPDVVREKQKKLPKAIDAIDASTPPHVAQGITADFPSRRLRRVVGCIRELFPKKNKRE